MSLDEFILDRICSDWLGVGIAQEVRCRQTTSDENGTY